MGLISVFLRQQIPFVYRPLFPAAALTQFPPCEVIKIVSKMLRLRQEEAGRRLPGPDRPSRRRYVTALQHTMVGSFI